MAIKSSVFRRTLGILALALCATQTSGAQQRPSPGTPRSGAVQAERPPKTKSAEPTALWDSLYESGAYFALSDSVRTWRGQRGTAYAYVQGLVAHAFNRPDRAISLLKPLVDNPPRGLTPLQRRNVVIALGQSYLRVFRYRESGETYAGGLRSFGSSLDSATRLTWRDAATLGSALRDVSPTTVSWVGQATLDSVAGDGIRFSVSPRINGLSSSEPLLVSEAAQFTRLDSTTAAAHRVTILDGSISMQSITGDSVDARIGVISSLQIGPVVVSNVVTLILRDKEMALSEGPQRVRGVIGFPVLNSIGRIGFLQDGHFALSSPGAPLIDTTAAARLALYDMPMQNLVPLIEGSYSGRATTLSLATRRVSADSLRGSDSTVAVKIGGRVLHLPGADVRESVVGATPVIARELGPHTLREADALTLDFGAMVARFVVRPPPPVLPAISYTPGHQASPLPESVPRELNFIALLFVLFIVPKALQRFRIPAAITSLVMGGIASGMGLFSENPTLHLLATLGIVALFLFAGLEIDGHELRRNVRPLMWHAAIWAVLATVTSVIAAMALGVSARVAALLALAIVTPSTGFILSSLAGFRLTTSEQRSVKTYAIGSELLALAGLFLVLQSTSVTHLAIATAALGGVVLFIPLAFRMFAKLVAPYAPNSEFAFLLMVAVVCAYATRRLGVYYLVGAFLVGVAAQRFRGDHPGMTSERMVNALEAFGSVFIPFYFFFAGTQIARDQLTPKALLIGLLLVVVMVPARVAVVGLHRRIALNEAFTHSWKVGASLVPTLVFTLVIAGILHDEFDLSNDIAGALVLYTVLNTLLPAYVLHGAPPEFENPEADSDLRLGG